MKRFALALSGRGKIAAAAGTLGFDIGTLDHAGHRARARERAAFPPYAADLLARLAVGAQVTLMAIHIGTDFLLTGRLTGLLLLASETLVVVLTIFRRSTTIVDRSVEARVLTSLSMAGPLLVRPASLMPLAPEMLIVAFSACGLLVVIGGKLTLGRSFGLIPANRGIVSTGLYRIVRHPIYMGYLVTHSAFAAANPTVWNIVVLIVADVALMARAVCEERTLARDAAYREYQQIVRWRVVPGIF